MKVWILEPILKQSGDPWKPWYDKCFGFVVIASSEHEARSLADKDAGDENQGQIRSPWLNHRYSTCKELTADGEARIVLRRFDSA
jgi:hypothetical protein